MTEENQIQSEDSTESETDYVEESVQSSEEECLPCEALDHLCEILPEEEGKRVCEQIKIGISNETMTAEEARDLLASKVGKQVLATKLAEVSTWLIDREEERLRKVQPITESIPLKEEPKPTFEHELPPIPEEMTKTMDEIAPMDYKITAADGINPDGSEMYLDESETWPDAKEKKKKKVKLDELESDGAEDLVHYNPDDDIIYKDLEETDIDDDPSYMWWGDDFEDDDEWIQDGKYDE